jgi:hypothetical protein
MDGGLTKITCSRNSIDACARLFTANNDAEMFSSSFDMNDIDLDRFDASKDARPNSVSATDTTE